MTPAIVNLEPDSFHIDRRSKGSGVDGLSYYDILGVSPNATPEDLRQAHRRLAQRFHPDLHLDEQKHWAEEHMKRVNEAYLTLKNPQSRARYDSTLQMRAAIAERPSPGDEWWIRYSAAYTPPRPARRSKMRGYVELAVWILAPVLLAMLTVLFVVASRNPRDDVIFPPVFFAWSVLSLILILLTFNRGRS